jgi:predicted permease
VTARHAMRVGVGGFLRGTDPVAKLRLRKGLIVAQLALSVLVLVAASLFTRTLAGLAAIDPGFDQEHVLIASTATDGYTPEQRDAFDTRLLQDVRALPGVVAAALANDEPLRVRTGWTVAVRPDAAGPSQDVDVSVAFVSPDYFRTMGMTILGGREFDERDHSGASTPIVVNERFAKRSLPPGTDPVGASFVGNGGVVFEIIGVVANSASIGLRDLDRYMLYVPGGRGVLHVRSVVPPATLIGSVRAVVQRADPQVPIFDVRTISEQIELAIGRERTFAMLSLTFGVLALVLSSVGLFSVMASAVSRRTKELGIRLALGAAPSMLIRSVFAEAAVLVACGALIGLPAAWLMTRAIRGLLFGMGVTNWQSPAVSVAVLAAVAAAAAWIPARRASRVDPLIALRSE